MQNRKKLAKIGVALTAVLAVGVGCATDDSADKTKAQVAEKRQEDSAKQDAKELLRARQAVTLSLKSIGVWREETLTKAINEQAGIESRGYNIADPASITVVVNKQRPIVPADYVPQNMVLPNIANINGHTLRPEAAAAMEAMYHDAVAATGAGFVLCSGYRSYDYQASLYNGSLAGNGPEFTEAYIARPGHSEHQLGLAIDIGGEDTGCTLDDQYSLSPSGQWVNANAHRYGFILRYAEGLTPIVGFATEYWHWRYVGPDVATAMHNEGVATLEEFFGTGAAPDYAN